MGMKIASALFATALMTVATPAFATTTIFTDQAAFLAALDSPKTEDFDDAALDADLTVTTNAGTVGGGLFNDRVVLGGASSMFTFANPINGFGGIFNQDPGGLGQGIDFALNGSASFIATIPQLGGARFFGFITDTKISSVRLTGGRNPNGSAETYNLNNLSFGSLAAAGVPEPSVWAFMILGFGAIGAALRSRKTALTTRSVNFSF